MSYAIDPFWGWLCSGVVLMALELFTPGFVAVFFGLAAVSVALLRAAVGDAFGLVWQTACFAVLSVAYVVALRKFVKSVFAGDETGKGPADAAPLADCAGRSVKVLETVRRALPGRVSLGDAAWDAVCEEDGELPPGSDAVVVSRRNLTLVVKKI